MREWERSGEEKETEADLLTQWGNTGFLIYFPHRPIYCFFADNSGKRNKEAEESNKSGGFSADCCL